MKVKMQKAVAFLLTTVLLLSLFVGCNSTSSSSESDKTSTASETSTTSPSSEEASDGASGPFAERVSWTLQYLCDRHK